MFPHRRHFHQTLFLPHRFIEYTHTSHRDAETAEITRQKTEFELVFLRKGHRLPPPEHLHRKENSEFFSQLPRTSLRVLLILLVGVVTCSTRHVGHIF